MQALNTLTLSGNSDIGTLSECKQVEECGHKRDLQRAISLKFLLKLQRGSWQEECNRLKARPVTFIYGPAGCPLCDHISGQLPVVV